MLGVLDRNAEGHGALASGQLLVVADSVARDAGLVHGLRQLAAHEVAHFAVHARQINAGRSEQAVG